MRHMIPQKKQKKTQEMIVVVGSNIGKEKKSSARYQPCTFGFLHLAYQKKNHHINDSTYKLLIPPLLPACWSIRHTYGGTSTQERTYSI